MYAPTDSGIHVSDPTALPVRLPAACTRLPLAWSMAGGIVAGGFLVAAVTLAGRLSASSITAISTVLFVLGGSAGLVHGGLLAYLARASSVGPRAALGRIGVTVLWVLPGAVVAWIATIWIGLTSAAFHLGRPTVVVGVALGWIIGLGICGWAVVEGVEAVGRMFRSRPQNRRAALTASVVFGVLVAGFHWIRPEIPFTEFRVYGAGAVLLALVATVWIALPVAGAALAAREWLGGAGRGPREDG